MTPDSASDEVAKLRHENERLRTKLMFAEAEIQGLKENIRKMRKSLLTPAGVPTGKVSTASRPMPDESDLRTPRIVRESPLGPESLLGRLLVAFDRKCFYCSQELDLYTVTLDHLHPKSKGGQGHKNMVPSCLRCNNCKGDRLPTGEEILRATHFHLNRKTRKKHHPAPVDYYPLENIQLGRDGRVICRTNASGRS